MATVAITITANTVGATVLTRTTFNSTDTFTLAYVKGQNMQMSFQNNTAAAITATLVGASSVASYTVPGTGGTILSPAPSAGKAVVVAANGSVEVSLDDIDLYLQGAVTVTGASTLIATVVSN